MKFKCLISSFWKWVFLELPIETWSITSWWRWARGVLGSLVFGPSAVSGASPRLFSFQSNYSPTPDHPIHEILNNIVCSRLVAKTRTWNTQWLMINFLVSLRTTNCVLLSLARLQGPNIEEPAVYNHLDPIFPRAPLAAFLHEVYNSSKSGK